MRWCIMRSNALMHHFAMWPQIIRLLLSKGFSQRELAEKVRVDQSTISRLSEGRLPEPRYGAAMTLIELAGGAEHLALEHGIHVLSKPALTPANQARVAINSDDAQEAAHA